MLLGAAGLEEYVSRVAELLERFGVVLNLPDGDLELFESSAGAMWFELRGSLPAAGDAPRSVVAVRELWRSVGSDVFERWEYGYELLEHERDFRRSFHLHDRDTFVRRFHVVVHEHCEHPIGVAPCRHIAGSPVRDAFRGVELLLLAWTDPAIPTCDAMPCLEARA